jgi:hypothetical protein
MMNALFSGRVWFIFSLLLLAAAGAGAAMIEEQLETLKKGAARGAITPEEHERERAKLLKQFLDLK